MPERPVLLFPEPARVERRKRTGGGGTLHWPLPAQQQDRFHPKLTALEAAFEERRLALLADPAGYEPEQVLVLETVGTVDDFFKAVRGIEGLEWLGEWNTEGLAPTDEFYDETHPDRELVGRVYLVLFNQQGLHQLLTLWRTFQANPDHPQFARGRTKWRDLFHRLRDLRPWGPRDRALETGLDGRFRFAREIGQTSMRVEIELWFRRNEIDRDHARMVVRGVIESAGGRVNREPTTVPEIEYHGLVATVPMPVLEDIVVGRNTPVTQCEPVRFFRPLGQTAGEPADDIRFADAGTLGAVQVEGLPVVAILDGLPLENHARLAGRLIVDDPDDWAATYPAIERAHGTAMASLVIHGELDSNEAALSRPVYVRPILHPEPNLPRRECIPEDILPLDLVHTAVRRLLEPVGDTPPAAPTVKIINLSVGDPDRQFHSFPSPWARLLDYLAWHYRVLFVVSAGNQDARIEFNFARERLAEIRATGELEGEAYRWQNQRVRHRRLLAPAESINALTVAATYVDQSAEQPPTAWIIPITTTGMPAPFNALGLGFRRSVKPDLLAPGGRIPYREAPGNTQRDVTLIAMDSGARPGQRVAAPGGTPGDLFASRYARGTSNAAALVSRLACRVYDMLETLRHDNAGAFQGADDAVLVKTLIVHGTERGGAAQTLGRYLAVGSRDDAVTRFFGYGCANSDRTLACTDERATLLGFGQLDADEAHLFRIPLPPALSGARVWRRLTVTLGWFTPINPRHQAYRRAQLWFDLRGDADVGDAVGRLRVTRTGVDWQMVQRGTLQHEVFEGDESAAFAEGEEILIQVNCRADAGTLEDSVPYGLAVTLEVAPGLALPIYEEIRARIRPRVRADVLPAQ